MGGGKVQGLCNVVVTAILVKVHLKESRAQGTSGEALLPVDLQASSSGVADNRHSNRPRIDIETVDDVFDEFFA